MSCSKIFSGDLPELTYEIIKCFQNDFSTLHSCILVNRLWCRLAVPLLWENPFFVLNMNYSFLEIYSNSNSDFKTKLYEYNIISNSLSSNTLFNYPKFLKNLNVDKFILLVERWIEAAIGSSTPYSPSIKRWIKVRLFKIFIENEANLHTLEIEISNTYYDTHIDSILELILQNPNFTHNIKNLDLYILSFCNNSKALTKNIISQLINLHQNLKKIVLAHDNFLLYQSILISKDCNCSNTLSTMILSEINFKGIENHLKKIFERLNVLESIHIINCNSLNTFIQQIINLTKPFKLKSFIMCEILKIESFQLLLQKSGDYLENFSYGIEMVNYDQSLKQHLLELITKYCKKIKIFYFSGPDSFITYQIINLIENIKQNLNHLSIRIWNDNNKYECSSIILQNLGQTLRYKLEFLRLDLHRIKASDFEIFLKNSQGTFFKKLLIYNIEGQDILPSIKEYIMKKKRVKYLAISHCHALSSRTSEELISLEDEVREFRLYDIEVKLYYDLEINLYDYINGIY